MVSQQFNSALQQINQFRLRSFHRKTERKWQHSFLPFPFKCLLHLTVFPSKRNQYQFFNCLAINCFNSNQIPDLAFPIRLLAADFQDVVQVEVGSLNKYKSQCCQCFVQPIDMLTL
jgi:hypothetical protein